jgi:hypothetical protein
MADQKDRNVHVTNPKSVLFGFKFNLDTLLQHVEQNDCLPAAQFVMRLGGKAVMFKLHIHTDEIDDVETIYFSLHAAPKIKPITAACIDNDEKAAEKISARFNSVLKCATESCSTCACVQTCTCCYNPAKTEFTCMDCVIREVVTPPEKVETCAICQERLINAAGNLFMLDCNHASTPNVSDV